MPTPRRYLLVLSHMRSYTTVLCHILNSNPEIDGYAELHMDYRSDADVQSLERRVSETIEGPTTGRYVLDKILHDDYVVSDAVLERDDVHLVFTVREPVRTIPSIMTLGLRTQPPDWKADAERAVAYYRARLQNLSRIAAAHPDRALFFDAEQLISAPDLVLNRLGDFLELAEPLLSTYEPERYTGREGYGDWSEYIGTGRLVGERASYDDIDVPADLLATAVEAYSQHRALLAKACRYGVGSPLG